MACTVQLKYYDSRSEEEIAASLIGDSHLYINGVSADGETTQDNIPLTFSFSSTLPGSGGYAFGTWRFSYEGSDDFLADSNTEITLDATEKTFLIVKCVLDPQPCTITYNYKNPSGTGDYVQDVLFADDTTKLILSPAYSGYLFKCWRIGDDDYAGGSVFTPMATNIVADAQWISFSDDESTLPAAEIEYLDEDGNPIGDAVVALKGAATALKNLNNGSGWTITGGGQTFSTKGGGSFTPNSSDKYSAREERGEKKYQVRFNTNNSAIQGQAAYKTQYILKGATVEFPICPNKTSSQIFRSWSCNGGIYKATDTMVVTKNCTATANYSESKEITVTFRIDTTKGLIDKTSMRVRIGEQYGELANVTDVADWNEFEGWFTTSAQKGGTKITSTSEVIEVKDHTLYARFKRKATYYLYPNGGTIDGKTTRVVKYQNDGDSGFVDGWDIPTREGFTVDGWAGWWSIGSLTGGVEFTNSTVAVSGKETNCYARWRPKVSYVSETGQTFTDTYETIGEKYSHLPSATPPQNKKFIGWYTEQVGGEKVTSNTKVVAVQTRTLYAHFSNVKQTVHFNKNGGKYDISDENYEYPGEYTAFPESEMDGNTFIGWFTDAQSGEQVKQGDTVTNESERTLYAHYDVKQTVHFYGHKFMLTAGYSDDFIVDIQYEKGKTYDVWPQVNFGSNPNYDRHWKFVGFYTYNEGGVEVKVGDTVTQDSERALHARYEKNNVQETITFDANDTSARKVKSRKNSKRSSGATLTRTSQSVFEGSSVGALPNGEKKDYTLVGFSTNSGGPVNVDSSYVPSGNETLYAQWKKKILLWYHKNPGD